MIPLFNNQFISVSFLQVCAAQGDFVRIPCFAHTLQLAINDGLRWGENRKAKKEGPIQLALGKARRLVTFFHHSIPATKALKVAQTSQGVKKPLMLVQDVATRWNSQLAMINRLLQLQTTLYLVCHSSTTEEGDLVMKATERKKLYPSDRTWKVSLSTCHLFQFHSLTSYNFELTF